MMMSPDIIKLADEKQTTDRPVFRCRILRQNQKIHMDAERACTVFPFRITAHGK